MALTGNIAEGSITGRRYRLSKIWYPTSDADLWEDPSVKAANTVNISSPVFDSGTGSSNNKYTACLKIQTPNGADIFSIQTLKIGFYGDRNTSYSGTGPLYGSLRTVPPSTGSTANDTLETYRTNVAGNSNEASCTITSGTDAQYFLTFTGTFDPNTTYYLYLYSKKTGDIFTLIAHDSYYTCTATYTKKSYTVSYNANGGSGTTSNQIVVYGEKVKLSSNNFTAPTERLYSVTLDGNGGKDGTPTYGNPVNKFLQWREGSTTGTPRKVGYEFTPETNITFYAQWYTPTTLGTTTRDDSTNPGYTITFDATTNGGTCNTTSLTVNNPVSHTFKSWNSERYGNGAPWDSTTAVYQVTSTVVLYAQWEFTETLGTINLPTASKSSTNAQNRTVTLNYNDGSGKIETKASTATITYDFQGWSTSATATTGSTGTYKPTSSHKLYAIFKGTTGTYSAVSLPSPTRTGYTFEGWGTSASATSGATDSYTPPGDITLYAIWKPKGAVRIYINGQGYRMAQVYLYANNKWNLTIPYLYDGSWRISS